jgi:hypothetical protein
MQIFYGLPCANFHETRQRSTALFVDFWYRISPKSYNKCGTYRSETNSFMSGSEVGLHFTVPIFTKLTVTQYIIWDIICTEYFPYWMKIRNRGILHLHQVKCGFHYADFHETHSHAVHYLGHYLHWVFSILDENKK